MDNYICGTCCKPCSVKEMDFGYGLTAYGSDVRDHRNIHTVSDCCEDSDVYGDVAEMPPVERAKAAAEAKARELNLRSFGVHSPRAKTDSFGKAARGLVAMGLRLDRLQRRVGASA